MSGWNGFHETIRRGRDGQFEVMDCPCGEDHGPSVDEERQVLLAENKALRAELAALKSRRTRRRGAR